MCEARPYHAQGNFIYGRHYGSELEARRNIALVRKVFEVVELTLDIVDAAPESDEPDFEDGPIRATTAEQVAEVDTVTHATWSSIAFKETIAAVPA